MRGSSARVPRGLLFTGTALLIAAVLWLVVGVPTFVKYPTDLDASPAYEGTFTLLVDPATAAPLAEPVEVPLVIERHIEAIGEESGSSEVVVRETIHQEAEGLLDTTQTNQYVMDRSSLENVEDDRAYAFDPENVVDRSPSLRLNLPFDTSRDETYEIYKNEIDSTYTMQADADDPTRDEEGLHLSNFEASVDEAPLSEAYLAELNRTVPLPDSMTIDELKPQLLAAGVDVDGLLAALGPVLTPEDTATLASFAAEPIPLDYVISFDGVAAVEPVTGAEVHVTVSESVGARPDLAALPVLDELLGHYPEVPEAVTARTALDELANGPAMPLFSYTYDQTPASVADIADEVSSMRLQIELAKKWLPAGLALAGALLLAIGLFVHLRRRSAAEAEVVTGVGAVETHEVVEERPLVSSGSQK